MPQPAEKSFFLAANQCEKATAYHAGGVCPSFTFGVVDTLENRDNLKTEILQYFEKSLGGMREKTRRF